jgi:L-lysine 6-transaminase
MTQATMTRPRYTLDAANVHSTLGKHILVDGFHVAIDLEKSHGSWIYDAVSEREILDFYSYFATLPIGHNHPGLVDNEEFMTALTRAAVSNPANSDIYAGEFAAFVETFSRLAVPPEFRYLFFIAGGALAVENGMKTAFDWKVKKNRAAGRRATGRGDLGSQVIHFREAFHGRSGYTLSVTNTDRVKIDAFPKFDWPRITNPKLEFPVTPEVEARVGELECQAVGEIERAFADNPHDIAAILIEPIQGEGGDNHFRPEFFRELRRLADEHEALLIYDEIQTGFGFTGKLWAYQHHGVAPDILAFGKKTQVCGIMSSDRVDDVDDNVFHVSGRINSTWGGNLVDMVRCARYLEVIEEENLVDNAARMGERLLAGLQELASRHPVASSVRGQGLFCAFTLPTTELRNRLRQSLWDKGLATLPSWPSSLRFRPCLTVSAREVDIALEILDRALAELEA